LIGLILAAAGSGSRFGSSVPKQFLPLDGVPIYFHSLDIFEPLVNQAVIVVPSRWKDQVYQETRDSWGADRIRVEEGGEHRQDSVRRGLASLPAVDIILIHDAARPFVTGGLISRVIDETRRTGACVPGLPISETVKQVRNSTVVQTLDRNSLVLVQTPQGFQREVLAKAIEKACEEGFYGTDEAVLVERSGHPVAVIPGEPGNIKITVKRDLSGRS